MGSACGLRFMGPKVPFGVCPGVRPGVRSAGDALIMRVVESDVRGVESLKERRLLDVLGMVESQGGAIEAQYS